MLTISQRLTLLVTFAFFSMNFMPLSARNTYEAFSRLNENTKSFAKKEIGVSQVLCVCAAAACVAGAFALGAIGLQSLFSISDENFLYDCENRYKAVKAQYAHLMFSSHRELEKQIRYQKSRAEYPVLAFKSQLEDHKNRIARDLQGTNHRITALSKKLRDIDEYDSLRCSMIATGKNALIDLAEKQRSLLQELKLLLKHVVELRLYYDEKRDKRKDDREREFINALNRPHVCLHSPCHHCNNRSMTFVL